MDIAVLAAVTASVRAFAAIMTERRGRDLEQWMTAATATGEPALRSFVTGLRADQVELATLDYVNWYNHRRLFETCGDIPPAELETAYYRQNTSLAEAG